MLSGAVLKQFRTYLKSQVGHGWSVEGRKSKGRFLTKKTHEYTYKELAAEFKCNFEHARRICIKLFTEGKIERTKIVEKVGRPFFKYWKK